jgi:hypothetical protein
MAPPYRLGKGPVVVALEKFLKEGDVTLWYSQLADEETYLKNLEPTAFDSYLKDANKEAYGHMEQDVFGAGQKADFLPADQLKAAEQKGMSRRLVYGRGMRRALEIAYGFGEGAKPRAQPWTIDLFWGCGQPFNSVALSVNPANEMVTVIVFSSAVATPGDGLTVVARDPSTTVDPDPEGDLFFVDDRKGVESVSEWRATNVIGFANSPDPAP